MTRARFDVAIEKATSPFPNDVGFSIVDFVDVLIEAALEEGLVEGVVSNENDQRRVAFHWAGTAYPIHPRYFGATCCRLAQIIADASLPFHHHEGNAVITRHFNGVEHQLQIEFRRLQLPQFIRLTRRENLTRT